MGTARGSVFGVVAVSFLLIGLGTAPAFMAGFLGAYLRTDLNLTRGQLGLVSSVLFGTTGLSLTVAGRLCEVLGARRCAVANTLLVTVAMALLALVPTYPVLLVAGTVCGLSYALGNVATNVAITAVAPPTRTGFLMAVKTAGVPAIAVVTALGGPTLAAHLGWRSVAAVIACATLALALPCLLVLPDSRRDRAAPSGVLPPRLWWLAIAGFLLVAGSNPVQSWTAVYLHDALHVSVAHAGVLVAIASGTSIVLLVVVARLTDWFGPARRCVLVASTCAVCASGLALAAIGPRVGLVVAVVGGFIGLWANIIAAALTHAVLVDRAPDSVGRASGMVLTGYYLGALIAPTGFGWLTDLTGSYAAAWFTCAAVMLLAALAYYQVHRVVPVRTHPKSVPALRVPSVVDQPAEKSLRIGER